MPAIQTPHDEPERLDAFQRDTVGYISQMSHELSRLAAGAGLKELERLLRLAAAEAQLLVARHDLQEPDGEA